MLVQAHPQHLLLVHLAALPTLTEKLVVRMQVHTHRALLIKAQLAQ